MPTGGLARPRWCGHLSQPQDDCGECDYGEIVSGGLFEARCDSSELFEFAEAAFDQMALGIEVLIKRMFFGARGVAGNDGDGVFVIDGLAEVVSVISGVCHDNLGGEAIDERGRLRDIAHLARGEREPHRTAKASHSKVDLGAQTAA
jgi:hypothetical protein